MLRADYLDAAETVVEVLRDPAVAARWGDPSALEHYTVGGLAGHLARQVTQVPRILAAEGPLEEPLTLSGFYARARWLDAGIDDDIHVDIRRMAEQETASGAAAVADATATALGLLREVLPVQAADRVVYFPWSGCWLSLDDYLTTRMMEIVVHTDDLAVSVDRPTPVFPTPVSDRVLALLTSLAVRRHGQAAVVRALSRAERAPASISAF